MPQQLASNPLLMPPVVNILLTHLEARHLHCARHVCRLWRHLADKRLAAISTLHWDFWRAPPLSNSTDIGDDDWAACEADLCSFMQRVLASCPFRAGWALIFVGSCAAAPRSSPLANLPATVVAQLRQWAPHVRSFVFDSYSQQKPYHSRTIGTVCERASNLSVHNGSNKQHTNAVVYGEASRASVAVLLIRAPARRSHVRIASFSGWQNGVAVDSDDAVSDSSDDADWPAHVRAASMAGGQGAGGALLLLSSDYSYHHLSLKQLQLVAGRQLPRQLAIGGGVVNATWRSNQQLPSQWLRVSGSCVRAVSCVLHANGSGDERRAQLFVRRMRLLKLPPHNTVALVFGNCAMRRRPHGEPVEQRLFRQLFASVPLVGTCMHRQVGCNSYWAASEPARDLATDNTDKHRQSQQLELNRSVTFVLLHVAHAPITANQPIIDL